MMILAVCVLIALLYVRPLVAIWSARGEASVRQQQVSKLANEHMVLTERVNALKSPAALEREARRLGMVKPGEQAYVIKGLPGGP